MPPSFAGPDAVDLPGLDPVAQPACWLKFGVHGRTELTRAAGEHRELACIGQILDPREPGLGNEAVLGRLLGGFSDFSALETATARLGGRWVLFARHGASTRVYPDATATKSVFHARDPRGGVWVASQPGLLRDALGLDYDADLVASIRGSLNTGCWPCGATPFEGVRQLLPNHYLDLASGDAVRFWPSRHIERMELDAAARIMADLLYGSIAAVMHRGSTALPLTGGYDSRTVFAAARDLRSNLRFFTTAHFAIPHFDIDIPRRLAQRCGVRVEILPLEPNPPEFAEALRANTAGMWWDGAQEAIYTFNRVGCRFVLSGLASELDRCWYYAHGDHPQVLSAEGLATMARFGTHPLAVREFGRWLDAVPRGFGVQPLDMLYWEHRAANWVSMLFTAMDTRVDPIVPFNSRELLVTGLGVDEEFRRAPHELHRRICAVTSPEVLEFPFNSSVTDTVRSILWRWVPWRVRSALDVARRRKLGLADQPY